MEEFWLCHKILNSYKEKDAFSVESSSNLPYLPTKYVHMACPFKEPNLSEWRLYGSGGSSRPAESIILSVPTESIILSALAESIILSVSSL